MLKTVLIPDSALPQYNVYEVLMLIDGKPRVEAFSGKNPADAEEHAQGLFPESPIHIARENCPFTTNNEATTLVVVIGVITFLAILASTLFLYKQLPH